MEIRAVSKLRLGPISLVESNLQMDRRSVIVCRLMWNISPPKSNNNGEQDN